MHGKGVFALRRLAKGEQVIEYTGEVIGWPEALRRHPHDPSDPNHTFYFHVSLPTTGSDAGDNALQGKSAGASFTWSATQA